MRIERRRDVSIAVLVSLLEADSELYNSGIVNKSHVYPKMYVYSPTILCNFHHTVGAGIEERFGLQEAAHLSTE